MSHIHVETWEERDRLHIALYKGDTLVAQWWDDDAREMFEDGFFKSGKRLEQSVIEYAHEVGLLKKKEVPSSKAHDAGLDNPPPTHVQTIVFERPKWTAVTARKWLREHGKKFGKVDVKENTLRFRQVDPKDFKSGEFAMIRFGEPEVGIQALVGHLKEEPK